MPHKYLLLCSFLPILVASAFLFDSNADTSEEDVPHSKQGNSQIFWSKHNFDLNAYRRTYVPLSAENLEGEELVNYVNSHQNLWRAHADHKFAGFDKNQKRALMGVNHVRNSVEARQRLAKSQYLDIELPKLFDATKEWGSQCPSVNLIRDQSSCGSCWAFGAVEAMSDRVCIASKGRIQPTLSARNLLSCCKSCGFGCNGGEPFEAWRFWHTTGIVTGSNFTANEGCQPYPFAPCEHHSAPRHFKPCPKNLYHTPKCLITCQKGYNREYENDKFYGKIPYAVKENPEDIMKELYTNGPLEITMDVYEDFLSYDGGVYMHQGGKLDGGHAVKLVGWGEENKVPYWKVANSWNTDWGENGYFRILRGVNECGIEGGVVGGLPDLNRSPSASHHNYKSENSYDVS